MTTLPTAPTEVPPSVRVELAHAALSTLAANEGVDVLLVKGPGMDPTVAFPGRSSSDVDLLVRPADLDRLAEALVRHGWWARDRFETGSPFEHSRTWFHPAWGDLDVHRHIPGFGVSAPAAFDLLWSTHTTVELAGHPCPVPEPAAQAVILCLHAARSGGSTRARADVEHAWERAGDTRRAQIRGWVDALDAHLAWSVVTGELERFREHPAYRLWKVTSSGGGRIEEWSARLRLAPTPAAKLRLLRRALLVNTDSLAIRLGRPPTRPEIARELGHRAAVGAREISQVLRRRLGRGSRS